MFPEMVRLAAASVPAVTLPAVPALWQVWLEAKVIPPNVRLAISASAPLPLAVERAVYEVHGLKIHNFYGSTECGGIAYDARPEPRADQAIAGTALQDVHLCVSEDDCLEVRSEAVGLSYWPQPDAELREGCFRSRDLAEIYGGEVRLRGRASDQINVAGRKVLPETIEKVLAGHPHVRECLAFGIACPDGRRGETIVACVAAAQSVTEQSLRQFVMSKLPAWQVPRHWWLVPSLAPNARGKLSRAEWRARYLAKAVR
jgi:acyl-CoA synthetase (AMP-forming)/AMP-acid ligase II